MSVGPQNLCDNDVAIGYWALNTHMCVTHCAMILMLIFVDIRILFRRSQWSRGLRPRASVARLLRLWVLIPPGAWMFVCCECSVLSSRGLCDGLITRPEESYEFGTSLCVITKPRTRGG
jgi:hypothetical protein